MIMTKVLKKYICKIECDGEDKGSGFIVNKDTIITASHVLLGEPKIIKAYFYELGDDIVERLCARVNYELEIDVEVLKLSEQIELEEYFYLCFNKIDTLENWESYGYPATTNPQSSVVGGSLINIHENYNPCDYDIDLDINYGNIINYEGLSGAPLIINETVYGILVHQTGQVLKGISFSRIKELLKLENIPINYIDFKKFKKLNSIYKYYEIKKYNFDFYDYNSDLIGEDRKSIDINIEDNSFEKFIRQTSWKQNLFQVIEKTIKTSSRLNSKVIDEIKELYEQLNSCLFEYKEIELAIEKKLSKLHLYIEPNENKYTKEIIVFNEIKKYLNYSYSKILFIVGESGAGKTYQLKRWIDQNNYDELNNTYYYYILLSIIELNDILNGNIDLIEKINEILGTKFTDLDDLNEFIIKTYFYRIKINIVIDNIDHFFIQSLSGEEPYYNLKKYISKITKYDFISWIITINTNNIFYMIYDDEFIYEYGWINKDKCDTSKLSNRKDIMKRVLYLDEINQNKVIGTQIVKKYINSVIKDDLKSYTFNNPMIAHIQGICLNKNDNVETMGCYYDFILNVINIVDKKISKKIYNKLWAFDKKKEMDQSFGLLLDKLIQEGTIIMSDSDSILRNNELYNGIELYGLRERVFEKNCIKLIPNLYWAGKIIERFDIDSNVIKQLCEFKIIKEDLIKDYINCLEKNNRREEYKKVVDYLIEQREISCLFVASFNCTSDCKAYIFDKLKDRRLCEKLDKRECFLIMNFIGNYVGSEKELCKILCDYSRDISCNNLTSYLYTILNKILIYVEKYSKLKACIRRFISCEVVSVSVLAGRIFAERLWDIELSKLSMTDCISRIINLIKEFSDEILQIDEILTKKGPQDKKSFIEYFILQTFKYIINKYSACDMKVHNLLLDKQYYFNLKNDRLSEILRSCVANEYGNYFSNLSDTGNDDEFKRSYIKTIDELCKNPDHEVKCKLMALHLITNSINQDKKVTLVDARMRNSLKLICTHKQLKKFCMSEGMRQFIIDNLGLEIINGD